MIDISLVKAAFEAERDTPYALPLSLSEVDNCCAGKHLRLKVTLENQGVPTRYRICWFKWSEIGLPKEVIEIPHEDECTHLYLEVEIEGSWKALDASWDLGLASILPVALFDNPFQGTPIGVPANNTLSPEESAAYMASPSPEAAEEEIAKNVDFLNAVNACLQEVRSQKYASNYLVKPVSAAVDQLSATIHPKYGQVSYGYLPNTKTPRGGKVACYILGVVEVSTVFKGVATALIRRKDHDDTLIVMPQAAPEYPTAEDVRACLQPQECVTDYEVILKPRNCFAYYQSVDATQEDEQAFAQPCRFSVPHNHPSLDIRIAFYFSPDNRFIGLKIKLADVYQPHISPIEFNAIQQASEYAISLIRLCYSPYFSFQAPLLFTFVTDAEDAPLPVRIPTPNTVPRDNNFNPDEFGKFVDSLTHIQNEVDDDLWLLGNSYNKRLPVIYRYLSLTKIFEKYKSEKAGVTFSVKLVAPYFQKYESAYQALATELKLSHPRGENYAFDLRGKVSHRLSANKSYTVSSIHGHFSYETEQFVERIAQPVAIDILNEAWSKLPAPHPIVRWESPPKLSC